MKCDLKHEHQKSIQSRSFTVSLCIALCRTKYLQAFNTDKEEFLFSIFLFFTASICASALATLILYRLAVFFFFFFGFFHLFFVHLLFRGAPTFSQSSVLCSALQQSGHAVPSPDLFFYVIDPFSSRQCVLDSAFTDSVTGKSYLSFFFFFSSALEVNSKDIGGWVGGELGVGCSSRVKGGWQTRLNCFKIALCSL